VISIGVDIGSTTTKGVVLDGQEVRASLVVPSGNLPGKTAREVLARVMSEAGVTEKDVEVIATTGYGRRLVDLGDIVMTEIKACALGALFRDPGGAGVLHTIIDVGGQDTKVVALADDGDIEDFSMNDKCAAGTGRFLEAMARTMGLDLGEMDRLSARAGRSAVITSMCSVFAESEVINLINDGVDAAEIILGLHRAMAGRVASLARRVGLEPDVMVTGGVAKSRSVRSALAEKTGATLWTFPDDLDPQIIGALGAAVIAAEKDVA
jgi:predicted CoA-substrate-specific enzyme activase